MNQFTFHIKKAMTRGIGETYKRFKLNELMKARKKKKKNKNKKNNERKVGVRKKSVFLVY